MYLSRSVCLCFYHPLRQDTALLVLLILVTVLEPLIMCTSNPFPPSSHGMQISFTVLVPALFMSMYPPHGACSQSSSTLGICAIICARHLGHHGVCFISTCQVKHACLQASWPPWLERASQFAASSFCQHLLADLRVNGLHSSVPHHAAAQACMCAVPCRKCTGCGAVATHGLHRVSFLQLC